MDNTKTNPQSYLDTLKVLCGAMTMDEWNQKHSKYDKKKKQNKQNKTPPLKASICDMLKAKDKDNG